MSLGACRSVRKSIRIPFYAQFNNIELWIERLSRFEYPKLQMKWSIYGRELWSRLVYNPATCLFTFLSNKSDGDMVHTGIEQSQRQFWFPETAIEAIDELVQIFLQIFAGFPLECA